MWNPKAESGLPSASGVVVTAAGEHGRAALEVTFAQPLPGVTCGADSPLQWVNDALTGPGFLLRNNTIQSRRFGALIMGRDGAIVGNHFIDNPGSTVLLL